ncbi:phage regulator Rha-like protein [Paraburkholderia tropica]|uniref:Rha family transcriptional regulator n=1 Tax=Paraburkholderia tropica TaxID=92647 RepID=UPI001621126D|nr:Rha family transcriptional regulator [Paraburkholderia tropica]MBB3004376.1 phage regulator Rha-like protein [Paraburkholderia tropica]
MSNFPFALVLAVDGEPRASSEIIARGVEVQHKNLLAMVRKYESDLAEFGPPAFQTRLAKTPQGGGRPVEYAMLNEQQATLLLAFMRNSPKVIQFKIALVKEFFRLRDELQNRDKNLWQQMQELIAREVESKVRASFGSHLMLERKREIPQFDAARFALESQMQPSLLN